ncbi:glycosyltransferase family 2 protein [Pectobacterium polaris]|uniref:glycosyltransferase family 2 protein n=1 Tax=Pectobacterium polaris TaxID=2042057 RepID=UPI000BB2F3AB|nr:glycosyltransferase [Pectobacterium polaris]ASY76564.1 hypothetical protein BJJ97_11880 [Pectobacterium polaris]
MNVSVVIPAYNAELTIKDCIQSVCNQRNISCGDLHEIIVVNDGSTDNTLKVLEGIKNENKEFNIVLYNKENGGVSSARNYGIKKATGDWIALLDSDDIWIEDKLSVQLNILKSSLHEIDFLGCARNNEKLFLRGKAINYLYKASVYDLLLKVFPQTSTALIRRSALLSVGMYDEEMTHSEDADLWVRICEEFNFFYHPDSLVVTGNGKLNFGQKGLSANLAKMHQGTLLLLDKCRERNVISSFRCFIYKFFYNLKYIRRVLIIKMRS